MPNRVQITLHFYCRVKRLRELLDFKLRKVRTESKTKIITNTCEQVKSEVIAEKLSKSPRYQDTKDG